MHGTRHFAPGTKVYLEDPHWDDRAAAIDVPRYSGKRVRVVVSLDKLEDFAVEKVSDPEIISAIHHSYQAWPYTSMAPSERGGIPWDESDESREHIEGLVEGLNAENEAHEDEIAEAIERGRADVAAGRVFEGSLDEALAEARRRAEEGE